MRVDVLYDEKRLEKNGFFANKLTTALISRGVHSQILTSPPIDLEGIDGIVMRTVSQETSNRLERRGIRVFNNAKVASTANDKHLTYKAVESLGINIMPYVLSDTKGLKKIDYSAGKIIKSRYGHGGEQVYAVYSYQEAVTAFERIGDDDVIVQDIASDRGRDVRAYFLGGEYVVSMLRTSSTDFRANFSLGGNAEIYYPNEELYAQMHKIIEYIGGDLIGIDFIFNDGVAVFNEIEDVVGCRMVYAKSDIDIIDRYAEYIVKVLEDESGEKKVN